MVSLSRAEFIQFNALISVPAGTLILVLGYL